MKKNVIIVSVVTIMLSCFVVLSPIQVQAQKVLIMEGSSTIRPVVSAAAVNFGKTTGVKFKIKGGGSSHGVKSVATGATNIGNASRYLKAKEKATWPNLVPTMIGKDGVAVIIHKGIGLKALTKDQIQKIYLGEITNWKTLGGPDLPVYAISKEHGRSTLELFLTYAGLEAEEDGKHMTHRVKGGDAFAAAKSRIIGSNQQALVQVAGKKGAIGYVSVGDAIAFAKKTGKILLPALDGVEATIDNVKNGKFPITRPLQLVTNGPPQGVTKQFIDYLLGPEGQKIVAAKSFVPIMTDM